MTSSSQRLAYLASQSLDPEYIYTPQEEEEIRTSYLNLIEQENFLDLLVNLSARLRGYIGAEDGTCPYEITVEGRPMSVVTTQSVITVGRKWKCDVHITDQSVSRVNAIIVLYPDRVIIIDPGSRNGIRTIERERELPLESSLPNARKTFEIQKGETAVLQCGDVKLTLSPKKCVVCLTNPRKIKSNCGHYVMCEDCATQIRYDYRLGNCPICRVRITDMQVEEHAVTQVRD